MFKIKRRRLIRRFGGQKMINLFNPTFIESFYSITILIILFSIWIGVILIKRNKRNKRNNGK
jgi:hypothetical protein